MIKKPSFILALTPLLLLIGLLTCNVFIFEDTLSGPNQVSLLLVAFFGILISHGLGLKWEAINHRIIKTIGSAMPSIIILLLIGSLSGTWLLSGVVPAMIYYGLDAISPKIFFLFSSLFFIDFIKY
jgi:Na+:H+ antiporter, NhaC family